MLYKRATTNKILDRFEVEYTHWHHALYLQLPNGSLFLNLSSAIESIIKSLDLLGIKPTSYKLDCNKSYENPGFVLKCITDETYGFSTDIEINGVLK